MTVPVGNGRSSVWAADGVNRNWQFPFKVISEKHLILRVISGGTSQDITSGFTATGLGASNGGSVVYPVAPAAPLSPGTTVQVIRKVPYAQPFRIGNQGGFHAQTHEDALDSAVMQIQQIEQRVAEAEDHFGDLTSSVAVAVAAAGESAAARDVTEGYRNEVAGKVQSLDGQVATATAAAGSAVSARNAAQAFRDDAQAIKTAIETGSFAPGNGTVTDAKLPAYADATAPKSSKLGYQRPPAPGKTTVAMPMIKKLAESLTPRDYGAFGDGTAADNKLADAAAAAFAENKNLLIPGDTPALGYTLSVPIILDISSTTGVNDRKRPSIIGEGIGTSRINYLGTGGLFRMKGTNLANEGYLFYNEIKNLLLVGPSKTGGTAAFALDHVAHAHFEQIKIENFEFGIYAEDLEFTRFYRCDIRRNGKGVFMTQRAVPDPNSSWPNNNVFRDCDIGLNDDYGIFCNGGTQVMLRDCQVAYNGLAGGPDRWGVKVLNACYQGGIGLNISGGYFEHNGGAADIVILSDAGAIPSIHSSVHNIIGASFSRVTSAMIPQTPATHHVYCSFHPNGGQQKVNIIGCGFKYYNLYTPNPGRPVVGFDPARPRTKQNCYMAGNIFMSDVEAVAQEGTGRSSASFTTVAALTTSVPVDDTIPQNTEGSYITEASITLNSPKNKVLVEVEGHFATSGAGSFVPFVVRGAESNAIAADIKTSPAAGYMENFKFSFEDAPGSLYGRGPVPYALRGGPSGAGTAYLNGISTGRLFGGALRTTIRLTEIEGD